MCSSKNYENKDRKTSLPEAINSDRIRDQHGYRERASALCARTSNKEIEVLWIFVYKIILSRTIAKTTTLLIVST